MYNFLKITKPFYKNTEEMFNFRTEFFLNNNKKINLNIVVRNLDLFIIILNTNATGRKLIVPLQYY